LLLIFTSSILVLLFLLDYFSVNINLTKENLLVNITDWFDVEFMFGVAESSRFGSKGFDIVIGNPPYVRQENIINKDEIINSITKTFVDKNEKSLIKINKRSDLYVYFYFKGLSLLKPNGIFCFINSNSWLDVGYGIELQEFLLRYMRPLLIVDNIAERSFEAGINTVIVLIQRPNNDVSNDDIIKFIAFKKPFSKVFDSDILKKVDMAKDRIINEDFRLISKTRKELWIEGIETEDVDIKENKLWGYKYIGDKWGGKYLRAPDIFFTILEKGKDKLKRLEEIAYVISGVITGDNNNYYKPFVEQFNYNEYLLAFKSPRDVQKIIITKNDVKWLLKKEPRFISKIADFLIGDTKDDRFVVHFNKDKIVFEHKFIGINFKPEFNFENNILVLNSTLFIFVTEIFGKSNLELGALYLVPFDVKRMLVVFPTIFNISTPENLQKFLIRPIKSIFEELGFDKTKPIRLQKPNPLPDRKALDDIIFDALGLTQAEREEVYYSVCELVQNRLNKARSV